jgi:hypothetical protein
MSKNKGIEHHLQMKTKEVSWAFALSCFVL